MQHRQFDDLRAFVRTFLDPYMKGAQGLIGTEVEKNTMIFTLVRVLYHLVGGGFVPHDKLADLAKRMLVMLSGKKDKVGTIGEKAGDRYKRKRMVKTKEQPACDTVLIMECKLWLCYTLQCVYHSLG